MEKNDESVDHMKSEGDRRERKSVSWKRLVFGKWSWWRPLRLVMLAYAVLLVIAMFFSERFIFPYNKSSYGEGVRGLVMLRSEDGIQIATRYFKYADEEKEKYLILYFHGNYEDIGHTDEIADVMFTLKASVLAMDYRGYGLSGGKPTEKDTYADAELVYIKALELGYAPERIIIWGRSVGSGVATEMAKRKQVKALVIESGFCSAFRVATKVPIVPFDQFNNLKKIGEIDEMLFTIHGDKDRTIPMWHSQKLHDAHRGKKRRVIVTGATHDDIWLHDMHAVMGDLAVFLEE